MRAGRWRQHGIAATAIMLGMRQHSFRPSALARVAGLVAVTAFTVAACGSDSPAISGATVDTSATTTTCVDSVMKSCDGRGGDGDGDRDGGDHGGRDGHGDFDPAAMQAAADAFTECLRGEGLDVADLDMSTMPGRDHDGPPPTDGSLPSNSIMPTDGGMPDDGGRDGDPVTRMVNDLALDTSDATVAAAVDACASTLTSAFPAPPDGGNTSTTAGA